MSSPQSESDTRPKNRLARRLILFIILASSAVTLIATAVQLYLDYRHDIRLIHRNIALIRDSHSQSLSNSVWIEDAQQIKAQLDGLVLYPDVEALALEVDGVIRWKAGQRKSAKTIEAQIPLTKTYRGMKLTIGVLHLTASIDSIISRLIDKALVILTSNALKTFVVAGFMVFIFHVLVARHLHRLADWGRALNLRETFQPIALDRAKHGDQRQDELDHVVHALNAMSASAHRAYADLRANETRLRDFAEVSSDWFWETDAELRYTFVSDRYEQMTGLKIVDRLGKRRWDFSTTEDPAALERHKEDLEEKRSFKNFEYVIKDGGRKMYLSSSGIPMFGDDGKFIGYRGTTSDITERKKAEAEIVRSREEAMTANHAKSEFLGNMSHEFRTPLNAILGYAQLMTSETFGPHSNPKYRDYAQDIYASGTHLLEIISDILDISKIEAGAATLEETEIDIDEQARDCIRMMTVRAEDAGIGIDVDIPKDIPALRGDERFVKQILLNLLSNAIKFTPKGGRIVIGARLASDSSMEISLADTGIGIAAEDIPKVYQPFAQVAKSYSRGHSGTGLGLTISKSLAELHGGSLNIESEPSVGTTVTIAFPPERTVQS